MTVHLREKLSCVALHATIRRAEYQCVKIQTAAPSGTAVVIKKDLVVAHLMKQLYNNHCFLSGNMLLTEVLERTFGW